ncbi:MAG TPA: hypothetical protein VEP49_04305, partial [Acidimicrobiia bacterium]|nr:hypothetical protein [Acidimicrobiia bacterium]
MTSTLQYEVVGFAGGGPCEGGPPGIHADALRYGDPATAPNQDNGGDVGLPIELSVCVGDAGVVTSPRSGNAEKPTSEASGGAHLTIAPPQGAPFTVPLATFYGFEVLPSPPHARLVVSCVSCGHGVTRALSGDGGGRYQLTA